MKTFLFIGLNALTNFLGADKEFDNSAYFPAEQFAETKTISISSDFIYNTEGKLIKTTVNSYGEDRFFVKYHNKLIPIQLTDIGKISIGSEIGYLARILSAEALIYEKNGQYHKISMFTRVCIAESIKNRKNSTYGFLKNYKTYKDVILYTGYATNRKEFKATKQWLKNQVAKKRFVQEVLPVAVFVYFNDSNFTNNATGFITPAKMTKEKYSLFTKRTLIEIPGIDPYYEFTFWKY